MTGTTDIEVKWVALSEEAETIQSCSTVKELRTKLCASRECFWTDIVMFDSHYNLIKETPENLNGPAPAEMICLMKPKQTYTDEQWVDLIAVHGLGGDEAGVERARKLIEEAEKDYVRIFTAALIKCIEDQATVELFVKYGANLENVIDEKTTKEDTQKLQDVSALLAGLRSAVKEGEPSEENVGMVTGLLTGIDSFVNRGLVIVEAPKAPATPQPKPVSRNKKKKGKSGAQEEKADEKEKEPEVKNDNLNVTFSEGVVAEVLKLLPSKSEKVRQSALAIISKPTNSPQKDLLADNNVFTYLLDAITSVGDDAALEYLTFANSILQGSRRRVATASQSNFLVRLLESITSTNADIRKKAIVALETALNNANLEVFTGLYEISLVQKLLQFVQVGDAWTEEGSLAEGETHPFGIALRLLLLCSKKIKEPTTTWESNVPLKQIEKADILDILLQSDNMDITKEALKLQAQFQIRTDEQEKAEQKRQEEEDEKNAEEAANAEPESVEAAEEEAKESEEGEEEEVPTTNGVLETGAADEVEEVVEEVADDTLRNRKGQQGNKQPATMKKGKRTKGRLGGQKTAETLEESAEQGDASQEGKSNDVLLLLTQYLAIILALFGTLLGTATEYGATGFNTVTDLVGNSLQDICPKRSKSKRKAPVAGSRA
jgi:hypothetical protein